MGLNLLLIVLSFSIVLILFVKSESLSLKRYRLSSSQYRRLYSQLRAKLLGVGSKVYLKKDLLPYLQDPRLLEAFQKLLDELERELRAFSETPLFGEKIEQLKLIKPKLTELEERYKLLTKAMSQNVKGLAPDLRKLDELDFNPKEPKGCYFCSRPFVKEEFRKVRTRIQSLRVEVHGCRICRAELQSKKAAHVLYFIKDGQPVHWSQVSGYVPSEDYWELNKHKPLYEKPALALLDTQTNLDFEARE